VVYATSLHVINKFCSLESAVERRDILGLCGCPQEETGILFLVKSRILIAPVLRFTAKGVLTVLTRGLVMKATLAFTFFTVLFLVTSVYAQSPCLKCLKAAQEELKQCLDNAISQEDKLACGDKQNEQAKVCEDGECKMEREKSDTSNDVLRQSK
jgi:hypothetical protein